MSMLISLFGGGNSKSCPDCGSDMNGGECHECGYGSEEDDGMEESEGVETQDLLDIKDELQRVIEKVNRLIARPD